MARRGGGWGRRVTERVLLPFTGPAEVTGPVVGRPASETEQRRETELRSTLERVVGPDGRTYVVERPAED
ncbi:hypothetical protein [Cellulomonas endophytica]|uniref:hypothetical protein n=1 Tax=Cellulomonas endophytica TaxID=2494735 RepID=UPI0010107DA8|nr:hypothetical protein [Cellulomonas endophytica]